MGTYRFRAPEFFLQDASSYASDVWALGFCIANLDLGHAAFRRRPHAIFPKTPGVLFRNVSIDYADVKKADLDIKKVSVNAGQSSKFSKSIKSKAACRFPWGETRGIEFKEFTRHVFTIDAQSRASAIDIAQIAEYLQDAP